MVALFSLAGGVGVMNRFDGLSGFGLTGVLPNFDMVSLKNGACVVLLNCLNVSGFLTSMILEMGDLEKNRVSSMLLCCYEGDRLVL